MMMIWSIYLMARWDFLLFLYGMACVEWDHMRGAHTPRPDSLPEEKNQAGYSRQTFIREPTWNIVSILGLFLLSQPTTRSDVTLAGSTSQQ
ncbi:hypothetical protein B0J13DRAFT_45424 [Dactylonectria estremocensis]|uniref:Secreted protein n=1 Tax=Dactylonectria estremocensis TaxID=1079267 RepID=A0A9P9J1C6_9HYPO|nr:hypothetical protein B0J13DRAFT_45424 [Dactylonectria estremocensis]